MSLENKDVLYSIKHYLKSSNLAYMLKTNIPDILDVAPIEKNYEISSGQDNSSISDLKSTCLSCEECRLCETRQNVVFGSGLTTNPRIAFVGEAPGADEDKTGEPFVGKAGELLTAAIIKGLKLTREDVYICNVVKCRPPENRTPQPDEIKKCLPYLEKQLELIKPKTIVCLGGTAQKALVGSEEGITKLRGKWLEWRGVPVMPTVHPVYVLRNPVAKKDFWEDLKKVMDKLGMNYD